MTRLRWWLIGRAISGSAWLGFQFGELLKVVA